ncbi:MAG TPA: hypothetical protein VK922_01005 [Gemmatimonadaceae bacterium]|nr:hypothetical protein [Gemmatimonadaceae bacterium]
MPAPSIRDALVAQLLGDATAHEAARYDSIGRRFDSIEHAFPRGGDAANTALRIALTFWDAWIDARNHGWQVTTGIQPEEWPVLARIIADDLSNERDITDARVRLRFDAVASPAAAERVLVLAARLRGG